MKIFSIGSEYGLYTNQLYEKLIEKTGYTVVVDKSSVKKSLLDRAKNIYDAVEWRRCYNLFEILRTIFHCLIHKIFYKDLVLYLIFKPIRNIGALKDLQFYSYYLSKKIEENNISVTHHNYLDVWTLAGIDYIKPNTKILCSFWGSDLMDYSYPFEYQYQYRTLHKADLITVTSYELKEQVLTKFGRELEPKIRYVQFVLSDKLLNQIKSNKQNHEAIKETRQELGVLSDKLIVCIGNSMNVYVNHKVILQNIQQLRQEIKDKIYLVIPASYGTATKSYSDEIKNILDNIGCEYRLLEKFMNEKELSYLRLASDIYLHAPVSDAQSATGLETMCAGNVFLTGSFMPYSNFTKAGLKFFTFNSYNEIHTVLTDVVQNFRQYKKDCELNSQKVSVFFSPETQIRTWLPVFKELENKRQFTQYDLVTAFDQ